MPQPLAHAVRATSFACLFALAALGTAHAAPGGGCQPDWIPGFGETPGTAGNVAALEVHDDGTGPALYVAGAFVTAGGANANRVARWDGTSWSALGGGVSEQVRTLLAYDDGGGADLIAGGLFNFADGAPANNVAQWDGTGWSALGAGTNGDVLALAAYDDGGGTALYAGGVFGTPGNHVARWDGSAWSALGAGTNGNVRALAVFDDGTGPALYVGGDFTTAGGSSASRIARWDGTSWSALGAGTNDQVRALAVWDDGTGPALYAGGRFTSAGGASANRIARWDGTSWSAHGSGAGASRRPQGTSTTSAPARVKSGRPAGRFPLLAPRPVPVPLAGTMASCSTCGTTILLGGTREGDVRFCGEECRTRSAVAAMSARIPDDVVERAVLQVAAGDCPVCGHEGPVDAFTSHKVTSLVAVTRWRNVPRISCRACATRAQLGAALHSALCGWWGFPWGLVMTPVQIVRNLLGLAQRADASTPSPLFQAIVREELAGAAVARGVDRRAA